MSATPRPWELVLDELLSYLPPGFAWPRDHDSYLAAILEPLARGIARLEDEAFERRQTEVTPATAIQCLEDYERILGPHPCRPDGFADTLEQRQLLASARWTEFGGASPGYFVQLAAARGVAISIEEFSPFRAGESECGESFSMPVEWRYPEGALLATEEGALIVTEDGEPIATEPLILLPPRWQIGEARIMDYWRVAFGPTVISWARNSEARCGDTPHADWERQSEVECAISTRRPAQTIPVFDYSAHAWQPPRPLLGAT
ncbi:MAG: YmfQ family protein [Opitutales bacterium]|nr:YmfQ family protein [Opitutales bacterium]